LRFSGDSAAIRLCLKSRLQEAIFSPTPQTGNARQRRAKRHLHVTAERVVSGLCEYECVSLVLSVVRDVGQSF
jgi:hypothetical protein